MSKFRTTCTQGPWCFSLSSGPDGRFVSATRRVGPEREGKMLHGQFGRYPGRPVACDGEADRLGLEHGYIQRYGRNLTRFVMSRAARKRGLVSPCHFYKMSQEYHRVRLLTASKGKA